MIPLIKLEGVNSQIFNITPTAITFFTKATPHLCKQLCGDASVCEDGASIIIVGGLPLQVKNSCGSITKALIDLRKAQEKEIIAFRKKLDKEDWEPQEGDDDDQF